jgi:hypothetical protein
LHEPETPLSVDRDIPDTEVIALSAPTPVFVDSTGRRRKMLRRLAYAFGALCMLYGGLISVSLAGGPVSSSAILPLPDLPLHAAKAPPKPSRTPVPTVTTPAPAEFAAGPLTRRAVDFGRTTRRTPAVIPAPATTKPTVTPTSSHPLESATTSKSSAGPTPTSASPTPSKSASSSPVVPPPSPPTSPTTKSDTGGTGGGAGSGGAGGGEETTTAPTGTTSSSDTRVGALGRSEVADQLGAQIGNDLAGQIGARIDSILGAGEAA